MGISGSTPPSSTPPAAAAMPDFKVYKSGDEIERIEGTIKIKDDTYTVKYFPGKGKVIDEAIAKEFIQKRIGDLTSLAMAIDENGPEKLTLHGEKLQNFEATLSDKKTIKKFPEDYDKDPKKIEITNLMDRISGIFQKVFPQVAAAPATGSAKPSEKSVDKPEAKAKHPAPIVEVVSSSDEESSAADKIKAAAKSLAGRVKGGAKKGPPVSEDVIKQLKKAVAKDKGDSGTESDENTVEQKKTGVLAGLKEKLKRKSSEEDEPLIVMTKVKAPPKPQKTADLLFSEESIKETEKKRREKEEKKLANRVRVATGETAAGVANAAKTAKSRVTNIFKKGEAEEPVIEIQRTTKNEPETLKFPTVPLDEISDGESDEKNIDDYAQIQLVKLPGELEKHIYATDLREIYANLDETPNAAKLWEKLIIDITQDKIASLKQYQSLEMQINNAVKESNGKLDIMLIADANIEEIKSLNNGKIGAVWSALQQMRELGQKIISSS